jgi:photosystem II stability/assembly factor-like uncharacterized protein
MRSTQICLLLCLAAFGMQIARADTPAASNPFQDPLVTPASPLKGKLSPSAAPIIAITKPPGGQRLVAAGLRGLILCSDDAGKHWTQAHVPVQTDLVTLAFVSAKTGWAAGHDGVILRTDDGGLSWRKQFDGVMAKDVLVNDYKKRVAAGKVEMKPFLAEVELNTKDGPNLPFLSIYFQDEHVGYAAGSFGMLIKTDDGGQTWKPWLDHIDNPNFLNLNEIREIGGNVYIVGEQGTVYRLDRTSDRFQSISPQYKGSLFRIVGRGDFLLVVGLNGTAYRSEDGGHTWAETKTGLHSTITAAALAPDGRRIVLAAKDGRAIGTDDNGLSFHNLVLRKPMLFSDLVAMDDSSFAFSGYQGIELQTLRSDTTLSSENK